MRLLEDNYKVYCPDIRGSGYSSYKKEATSFIELGKDIINFTEKLNINNFYIIGHSFGSMIANEMAILISNRL